MLPEKRERTDVELRTDRIQTVVCALIALVASYYFTVTLEAIDVVNTFLAFFFIIILPHTIHALTSKDINKKS